MTTGINKVDNNKMDILLVGNNPTEIRDIYYRLAGFENPRFVTHIAFDLTRIFRRIRRFRPYSIIIDDRFSKTKLNRLIKRIHRNPKTREIPVTLLKSNNSELGISADFDNYILKGNLTAENLHSTIINSRQLRKTSLYLYQSYKRSRNLFQKILLDLRKMYWFTEKL